MIRHEQTIKDETGFGGTKDGIMGNCFQTAVASLFDLEISEVPHFVMYADWFGALRRWAREREADFSYFPLDEIPKYQENWDKFIAWAKAEDAYLIADGPSPRGDFWHVVLVDSDLNLAHDPHPSQKGLVEVKGIYCYQNPYEPGPVVRELTGSLPKL